MRKMLLPKNVCEYIFVNFKSMIQSRKKHINTSFKGMEFSFTFETVILFTTVTQDARDKLR